VIPAKNGSTVSVNDLSGKDESILAMYPNPATSEAIVNFNAARTASYKFELIDMTGAVCNE